MSADLETLLGSLPEGADPFAIVQQLLDEEVFPTLSQSFWSQVWLSIGLLVTILICFVAGFVIRLLRKRVKLVLRDGSLTRPDPRICVPILWIFEAIFLIIESGVFRYNMLHKKHTVFIGRFWLLLHIPLILSYALVTSNVMASSPPIRRHFSRMRHGVVWFNVFLFLVGVGMSIGVVPPAIALGNALHLGSVGYNSAVEVVRNAASKQDPTLLAGLAESMAMLEKAGDDNARSTRIGNLVYAVYIFFFMACCIVPGIILTRYVNKKISRLRDMSSSSISQTQSRSHDMSTDKMLRPDPSHPQVDIQLHNLSSKRKTTTKLHFVPDQPQDRPFAHLLRVETPELPSRFNDILVDKSHTFKERAYRLKRVLQSDVRFMVAYTLLLCAYAGMTVFESAKGQVILSTRQDLELSLAFPTWNFVLPGLIVSITFLYDALAYRDLDDAPPSPTMRRASVRFQTPQVSVIQCSQVIDVVIAEERKRSDLGDFDEEKLQTSSGRSVTA